MKISVEQLKQLNKEEYILIDIRDAEEAFKNIFCAFSSKNSILC